MHAEITAIIPTYNTSPYPADDKRNLLYIGAYTLYQQTLPPKELVIVDDCSQDSTNKGVQNLRKHFRDLKKINWLDENVLLVVRKQAF